MEATTAALCACGVPVFEGDMDVCGSCARGQRAQMLTALKVFINAFNLPDDGSEDRHVERWFRKPIKLARAAIERAEGSAD